MYSQVCTQYQILLYVQEGWFTTGPFHGLVACMYARAVRQARMETSWILGCRADLFCPYFPYLAIYFDPSMDGGAMEGFEGLSRLHGLGMDE